MTSVPPRLSAALAGRYTLERPLGQGGMATVYLAHDARHDRRVAVKVLRPELAAILGAERFLAEIKTTANLQHPHILSLFDSGEADGTVFYVMPYVEGESLRDRLTREKQLPVDEAVRLAREVADALEYAHQKGIIHRDIKPENIMLHGGHALVADFGIALAASRSDGGTRLTETGMSLGTPYYMAPEQAMGEREITARADVYALGCVLYEMLVAEPPFQGATAQAIIARVMTEEPRSLTLQRKTIPPHVEAAVLTALSKLPADRFASAAQFAAALGDPGFATRATVARVAATRAPGARVRALVPWVIAAGAVLALAASRFLVTPPPPPPVQRLGLELPATAPWEDKTGASMDLTPDATSLVYTTGDSGGRLYLRPLNQLVPSPLAGTEGAFMPLFSPDGRWVAFNRNGMLHRVAVAGGSPEPVCPLGIGFGTYAWRDARTLLAAGQGGFRLCSVTGEVVKVPLAVDSMLLPVWPTLLPGGRRVVFALRSQTAGVELATFDLETRTLQRLGIEGSNPHYVSAGYLTYVTLDGVLHAVPFALERLRPTGDPLVVLKSARVGGGGAGKLAVALDGTIVAASGVSGVRWLARVDAQGTGPPVEGPGAYTAPRFSPDGSRIALQVGDVATDIWIYDVRQQTLSRLTFDNDGQRPTWTKDGKRILFSRIRGATGSLWTVPADGSAPPESLLAIPGTTIFQSEMSPDGRTLLLRVTTPSTRRIMRVRLDSAEAPVPILASRGEERGPAISPDGRWLAYSSNESGGFDVYVRSFPDLGARYQVSVDGGDEVRWSPRGDGLYYRKEDRMILARVRTAPAFEVLDRTTLFTRSDLMRSGYEAMYDVDPRDGTLLVVQRRTDDDTRLTVILNWFANLAAGRLETAEAGPAQ